MSKFERECRYIVIKRKDLALVPVAYRRSLVEPLGSLMSHIPHREYVVVESDWPEYETVWRMIEARVTGQPSELEQLRTEAQALRDQVKALQSDANSYQSGYDEGRRMGTKHRQDEVEQLTREVAALRARVVVVPDWKPLTGPGQIKKGDLLRFAVAGKEIEAPAQLIINEGTGKEEIVYNRGKNHYFITSMLLDRTSWAKRALIRNRPGEG